MSDIIKKVANFIEIHNLYSQFYKYQKYSTFSTVSYTHLTLPTSDLV